MKKFISTLLIIILCSSGLTATAAEPFFAGEVTAVSFASLEQEAVAILNNQASYDSTALPQLTALLKSAKPAPQMNAPTEQLGEFFVTTAKKTFQYTIGVRSDDTGIFLFSPNTSASEYRVDRSEWNAFVSGVSKNLFTYYSLPTFTIKTGDKVIPLGITEASYAYRKLDGQYYRITPSAATMKVPTIGSNQLEDLSLGTFHKPKKTTTTVSLNDKTVWTGDFAALSDFKPRTKGEYLVSVQADYSKTGATKGSVTSQLKVTHGGPSSETGTFSVEGSSTYPGEFVVLQAHGIPTTEKITVTTDVDFTPTFFDDGDDGQIALMPVSYRHDVGTYNVTLQAGDEEQSFSITLNDKTFQIQYLTADPTNASETLLSEEANEEFEKHIAPIRTQTEPTPYWKDSAFIWPVSTNKVTTQFGMKRYVNGAPTSYRHGAIDYAVPLGTKVAATNGGKVLFAGSLQLTGNTVVIEHGYGLKSWYYHMNSLAVTTGDTLTVGAKIGEVGSTGFSTGPHLHFGMSINNVFINPTTVLKGDLLKVNLKEIA